MTPRHPGRLLPSGPARRALAREPYLRVADRPIVSPRRAFGL